MNEYNNDGKIPNYKLTKGVKKICEFNNLQNFHMLDNCSLDLMHDVNEGVIPFFAGKLLNLIIDKKYGSCDELQQLCRDFNYGQVWKKYKPSLIKLDKLNLGQNAMQNYCLIIHFPFILFKFKSLLGDTWCELECFLKILQILYSHRICENDLERFDRLLKKHLSYLTSTGGNLLPKHHMTTHYANSIRKSGPIIHSWMMRFESKHKVLTDFVHLSQNYKNISFTLAKRHQARECACKKDIFKKPIISKILYDISNSTNYNSYKSLIENDNNVRGVKFLIDGSMEYRAGLLLIEEKEVYEILHVVSSHSHYFVVCNKYNILQFVDCLNSIEIEKIHGSYKLFNISQIQSYKTYAKVFFQNKIYIIADTLNVFSEF